jgi:diguanylate cyclase
MRLTNRSSINSITPQKTTIISAVFSITQDYQIKVIAEGIETEDELYCLLTLGCKYGQGYILSKPQNMNGKQRTTEFYFIK